MSKQTMHETAQKPERALVVGIQLPNESWPLSESLSEMESLAASAGVEVVGRITQKLDKPNGRTLVGKGKVAEIVAALRAHAADVLLFDSELSPGQQFNLEHEIKGVKILDRTALILDIFALHAQTRAGRLQVRLAQNQYLLPRLRGMWEHLAAGRMGGGVGSRFGEGESQLEVDRRLVRKRIETFRRELAKLEQERDTQRKARSKSNAFAVALAGYTNAGKSSLLNRLTGANVLAYDKLFATLDSTTRRLSLPTGRQATLTDTVGFIHKLPTTLVESFKSTLMEIADADLIIQVVDVSAEQYQAHIQAVNEVLEQIGALAVSQLLVFNKADLISTQEQCLLATRYPQAVLVSAQTGLGTKTLLERIEQVASAQFRLLTVLIPFTHGALVEVAHQQTTVLGTTYRPDGVELNLLLAPQLYERFVPYAVIDESETESGNQTTCEQQD
ncbi:MAG: GTPase HflX [Coriobacteriales bacterium]|jgi:GTP-binding protein HflX|nr:GTPase HflX [Coriobacteriales bacterium]